MVQIVLIRPGTTDFDQQGRIQGTLDIPLCECGQTEVRNSIDSLRGLGLSVIYGTPCQAAWQTATIIAAGLGIKAKKLEKVPNLDLGLWQGMLLDDVKRKNPRVFRQWQEHPEMVCPPEGETVVEARERVEAVIVKLQKKHKEGAVGLVVPEPLASIVHCVMSHSAMAEMWKTKPPGAAWEVFGIKSPTLTTSGSVPGQIAVESG